MTNRLFWRGAATFAGMFLCGGLFFAWPADVVVTVQATLVNPACVINNGAAEVVDFGQFSSSSINLGAPPDKTSLIKTVSMPIACTGTDAASITLRLVAVASAQNPLLIGTDKPELGIAMSTQSSVADSALWIAPNTGILPVSLQDGQGTVLFYATPIGTELPITRGTFSAQAVLNVEYQ
ncbi:hypothetical protein D3C84_166350 [compost metagenome]